MRTNEENEHFDAAHLMLLDPSGDDPVLLNVSRANLKSAQELTMMSLGFMILFDRFLAGYGIHTPLMRLHFDNPLNGGFCTIDH